MANKAQQGQAALLIYIEPTPYLLGLIRRIAKSCKAPVEVLFIAANLSQPWNLSLSGVSASYLPGATLAAALEIARKLSTARYGLLHLAGWGHRTLLLALLLAWLYRVPVFMESDTQLPVGLPLWKRAVKRLLYPLLFRIPQRVLPGGSRQAEYFRHYGVGSDRIVKAQMTVDVAEIMSCSEALRKQETRPALRNEFGFSESQVVFIYVGRLETYKGIESLLDAFDRLSRTHPEAALLVVGDGSERRRVEAASRVKESIHFVGRLDYDQVIRAYSCADVAVVPSILEPWGLVVNEAMAVGLPVIVSDRVGCVDDLVEHGETGMVYHAGSIEELNMCMMYLLENPNQRTEMGKAGRRLISGWTLEQEARTTVETWCL